MRLVTLTIMYSKSFSIRDKIIIKITITKYSEVFRLRHVTNNFLLLCFIPKIKITEMPTLKFV
jgi:hypothetical protein